MFYENRVNKECIVFITVFVAIGHGTGYFSLQIASRITFQIQTKSIYVICLNYCSFVVYFTEHSNNDKEPSNKHIAYEI
jgi:hypothetical protein